MTCYDSSFVSSSGWLKAALRSVHLDTLSSKSPTLVFILDKVVTELDKHVRD